MTEDICNDIEEWIRNASKGSDWMSDEQIRDLIDSAIIERAKKDYIPLKAKLRIREQVFHAVRGYDCLDELLQQDDITEVMINGYNSIFIERKGKLEQSELAFSSEERYMNVIQQIVAGCNRIVNESHPIVDARLAGGERVNIVMAPVALNGAVMTIRRFPKNTYGMRDLMEMNMLSEEMALLLQLLVQSRYNILISGGTSSGKTTFLNALSGYISSEERVITIEDSAELQIQGIPNLVRLEVRNANVEGKNEISIKHLIRSALRMRPDRIIVGEVRGEEAVDMLQAMNTGHSGSLSTAHANSAKDMLYRLETMVLMGMDIPLLAIRQQIASALDVIVHTGRCKDGKRRVLEIAEVVGMKDGEIELQPLYLVKSPEEMHGDAMCGDVKGTVSVWKRMGRLKHENKLKESGNWACYQNMDVV